LIDRLGGGKADLGQIAREDLAIAALNPEV
jgi:hypothetical protein